MSERIAVDARSRRWMVILVSGAALCYLVGYPLAIIGNSNVGWIFVALGGPFLLGLAVMVIRRVHLGLDTSRWQPTPPNEP